MDQTQRGDFLVFINDRKSPGDARPIFEGYITRPGSEEKLDVTIWAQTYQDRKTGEQRKMYSGVIGATSQGADAYAQIDALSRAEPGDDQELGSLTLRPRQIVLFANAYKDEAPEKKRPDYWGGVNFGDGTAPVRLSAWVNQTRYGKAMLAGETSYPIPGKSEKALQDTHQEPLFGEEAQVTKPKGRRTGDSNPGMTR